MKKPARSPFDQIGGMIYFPRLLDKIRLHARNELRDDLIANLGKGADGWCCRFLRVSYDHLQVRVLTGGTDEEILEWCYQQGHLLDATDLFIWNSFITKLGWNDRASERLKQLKADSGLAHRDDIVTMSQYIDTDEGRG